jgi:hypothetical protein
MIIRSETALKRMQTEWQLLQLMRSVACKRLYRRNIEHTGKPRLGQLPEQEDEREALLQGECV